MFFAARLIWIADGSLGAVIADLKVINGGFLSL